MGRVDYKWIVQSERDPFIPLLWYLEMLHYSENYPKGKFSVTLWHPHHFQRFKCLAYFGMQNLSKMKWILIG